MSKHGDEIDREQEKLDAAGFDAESLNNLFAEKPAMVSWEEWIGKRRIRGGSVGFPVTEPKTDNSSSNTVAQQIDAYWKNKLAEHKAEIDNFLADHPDLDHWSKRGKRGRQ